jgi:hypothetical protein
MSSPIAAFLVAEIAVAMLPRFLVRPATVVRGIPYDRAQPSCLANPDRRSE